MPKLHGGIEEAVYIVTRSNDAYKAAFMNLDFPNLSYLLSGRDLPEGQSESIFLTMVYEIASATHFSFRALHDRGDHLDRARGRPKGVNSAEIRKTHISQATVP